MPNNTTECEDCKDCTSITIEVEPCAICDVKKVDFKQYFKCHESYTKNSKNNSFHKYCNNCFESLLKAKNNDYDYINCPLCKAGVINECKPPNLLSIGDQLRINTTNILLKHIFIHQNFIIKKDYVLAHVVIDGVSIDLYFSKGSPVLFHQMYVSEDGFLYHFDTEMNTYRLAVNGNKYQFWDMSRLCII